MKSSMKMPELHKWSLQDSDSIREFIRREDANACWQLGVQRYPAINVDGVPTGLRGLADFLYNGVALGGRQRQRFATCNNPRCFNPKHISRHGPKQVPRSDFVPRPCMRCRDRKAGWKQKYCAVCREDAKRESSRRCANRYNQDPVNRERQRLAASARRKQDPEKFKDLNRQRYALYGPYKQYGMTRADFDSMSAEQGNKCRICSRSRKLHVDHCHKTGRVRGLLCGSCNRGLGMFSDSIRNLDAAIVYLKERSN